MGDGYMGLALWVKGGGHGWPSGEIKRMADLDTSPISVLASPPKHSRGRRVVGGNGWALIGHRWEHSVWCVWRSSWGMRTSLRHATLYLAWEDVVHSNPALGGYKRASLMFKGKHQFQGSPNQSILTSTANISVRVL